MSHEKSGAEPEINAPQATKPAPAAQTLRSPRREPRRPLGRLVSRRTAGNKAIRNPTVV